VSLRASGITRALRHPYGNTHATGLGSRSSLAAPGLCAGLTQLQHLSLGWCPALGETRADVANSITPLRELTALTHLSLGGTKVTDGQARLVLPLLTRLQVRWCAVFELLLRC
jgi:hypothetical protein